MDPIIITHIHKDTLITYDEAANLWRFTLRSRDRSSDSLAKAKEIIDKPAPAKEKPFAKIKAWLILGSNHPERVEITSIAESRCLDANVWITKNGQRSKESVSFRLYPSNEVNDGIAAEIIKKHAEIALLKTAIGELKCSLQPLNLDTPKD